jgi:uncharacterized repeat protein (TIGR01451 family)
MVRSFSSMVRSLFSPKTTIRNTKVTLRVDGCETRIVPSGNPFADASVRIQGPAAMTAGDTGSYNVMIQDNGPGASKGNYVFLDGPAGTRLDLSHSGAQVVWAYGDDALLRVPDIQPGRSQNIPVGVVTSSSVQASKPVTFSAYVISTGSIDRNPGNNSASMASLLIAQPKADLALIASGPATVLAGKTAVYTLTASNRQGNIAAGGTISLTIPAWTALDQSASTKGWRQVGDLLTFDTSVLRVGQSQGIRLGLKPSVNTFDNTVVVLTPELRSPLDSNPTNNRAKIETVVTQPRVVDMSVKMNGPANMTVGGIAQYIVTVQNQSFRTANGTETAVVVPSGMAFVSASEAAAVINGSVVWKDWEIGAGESRTYVLNLRPLVQGDASVSVRVSSSLPDPNAVNNGATVVTRMEAPVRATMSVTVKEIGSGDVLVKNQKNVNGFRFEIRAGDRDVLLTGAQIKALQGNLVNGQNYAVWVDTGSGRVDTILQDGVVAMNGSAWFLNLRDGGFVVPKNATVAFEIHFDVSASLTSSSIQLGFDTGSAAFIQAEDVATGAGLTPEDISVVLGSGPLFQLHDQGDLYVTRDTVPAQPHQLLGGTARDTVLRAVLYAKTETADAFSLQVTNLSGALRSVAGFWVYKAGDTLPFGYLSNAGSGVYQGSFQNRQLLIPKGTQVTLLFKPDVRTDTNGAVSGESVQIRLTQVLARGDMSSNNLSQDPTVTGSVHLDINVTGVVNTVVLSRTSAITRANPDADGSVVPSGFSVLADTKFAGDPNNDTLYGLNHQVVDGLVETITSSNVGYNAASFVLFNKADSSTVVHGVAVDAHGTVLTGTVTGNFYVIFDHLTASGVNTRIDGGTDQTLAFGGIITNSKVLASQPSRTQVSLDHFNDSSATQFGVTGSHLKLIDQDSGRETTSTLLWADNPNGTIFDAVYVG